MQLAADTHAWNSYEASNTATLLGRQRLNLVEAQVEPSIAVRTYSTCDSGICDLSPVSSPISKHSEASFEEV
jgi:hypothetical protein